MGLFGKKTVPCPVCTEEIPRSGGGISHWIDHVEKIETGSAAGFYTWRCVCGPADIKWPETHHAAAGMALHMMQRHQISI